MPAGGRSIGHIKAGNLGNQERCSQRSNYSPLSMREADTRLIQRHLPKKERKKDAQRAWLKERETHTKKRGPTPQNNHGGSGTLSTLAEGECSSRRRRRTIEGKETARTCKRCMTAMPSIARSSLCPHPSQGTPKNQKRNFLPYVNRFQCGIHSTCCVQRPLTVKQASKHPGTRRLGTIEYHGTVGR